MVSFVNDGNPVEQTPDEMPQFQYLEDMEIYGWYSPEFRRSLVDLLKIKYKEFIDLRDLFKEHGYRSEGIVECFESYLFCVKVLLNTFYTKNNEEFLLQTINESMPAFDNGYKLENVYKVDKLLRPVVLNRSFNFITGFKTFIKNEFGKVEIDDETLTKLGNVLEGSLQDPLGLSGVNKLFRAVCVVTLCGFFDNLDPMQFLELTMAFLKKRHDLYKIEIDDMELPTWEALNYQGDLGKEL